MACDTISPISAFQSTNLNSKIDSFSRLGSRITRALGAPMVNVEIHHDQLFENISIACEFFTKYAGYTEEYLVFDSDLYEVNKGIRLDLLFSITPSFNRVNLPANPVVHAAISAVPAAFFSSSSLLSATYSDGIFVNQLLSHTDYLSAVAFNSTLAASFSSSTADQSKASNAFDYDVMDYRKVISVLDFEEGSTNGVNTLFSIEQTLAQQTYFSYSMGNYGFDLISWYILKDWLKVREKLLSQKRTIVFNDRTQYLVMNPSPKPGSGKFYGIIACYVERPLKDIIKEQWVYQYALALSKISVGMVRGKYTGVSLFGGGSINANLLEMGLAEKEKLEEKLLTGASPGFGDSDPPMFFVG